MITRDYFLRMIHQLAQVIAKVLGLAEVKRHEEALGEVDRSSKQLLGMDLRLLTSLSDEEHIRLLSLGERFEVERCVVTAELLRLVGEVKAREGDEGEGLHCYTTSLSLLIELLLRESGTLPKEYYDEMDLLIQKVSEYKLSLSFRQKLFTYYDRIGRFDAAENVLFEMVAEDPSLLEEGMKFYERLRRRTEDELKQGNLSRDEVEASIKDLVRQVRTH